MAFGILGRCPVVFPSYSIIKWRTYYNVIEDHKLDTVPGTGLLSTRNTLGTTDETRELKRGTGRHSQIVLIPQPSDDPRDPCVHPSVIMHTVTHVYHSLNWPTWKKEACFWTL